MASSTTKSPAAKKSPAKKSPAKKTPAKVAAKKTPAKAKRRGAFDSGEIVKYVTKSMRPVSAEQVAKHLGVPVNGPLHVRLGWLAGVDHLIAVTPEKVPPNRRTYWKPGTKPAALAPPKVTKTTKTAAAKTPAKGRKADPGKGRTRPSPRGGRDHLGPKRTPRKGATAEGVAVAQTENASRN
jgi:hypothetical protein